MYMAGCELLGICLPDSFCGPTSQEDWRKDRRELIVRWIGSHA